MKKKTTKNLKSITHKSNWRLQAERTSAKRYGVPRRTVALRWASGKSANPEG